MIPEQPHWEQLTTNSSTAVSELIGGAGGCARKVETRESSTVLDSLG